MAIANSLAAVAMVLAFAVPEAAVVLAQGKVLVWEAVVEAEPVDLRKPARSLVAVVMVLGCPVMAVALALAAVGVVAKRHQLASHKAVNSVEAEAVREEALAGTGMSSPLAQGESCRTSTSPSPHQPDTHARRSMSILCCETSAVSTRSRARCSRRPRTRSSCPRTFPRPTPSRSLCSRRGTYHPAVASTCRCPRSQSVR